MALNKSVVNNDPQGYPDRVVSVARLAFGFMNVILLQTARTAVHHRPKYRGSDLEIPARHKPDDKPKLEVASWQEEVEGNR